MVQLLTSMKKQVSPTYTCIHVCTACAVSTVTSDKDRSRTIVFDGVSYNHSSEVSDASQYEYTCTC